MSTTEAITRNLPPESLLNDLLFSKDHDLKIIYESSCDYRMNSSKVSKSTATIDTVQRSAIKSLGFCCERPRV